MRRLNRPPLPPPQPRLVIRPCELKVANAFVASLHRHHSPVTGHRWSIAVHRQHDDVMVGVAIVGRPVARKTDPTQVVEVLRVCTDGTPNACSALYAAACRQQRAHGYAVAQTFILDDEPGTSLRAAGWRPVAWTPGRSWSVPSRSRTDRSPLGRRSRWECQCSQATPLALRESDAS